MRSHKAPRGSFINQLKSIVSMKVIRQGLALSGTTEEQATTLINLVSLNERDDEFYQYTDTRTSLIGHLYYALSYIKKRPTDLILDKTVKEYLEETPLNEEILLPNLEKGLVWIDLSTWSLVANSDVTGRNNAFEKIKGILLVENDEAMKSWSKARPFISETLRGKFKETDPDYWCYVHASGGYFYAFPLSKTVSFGELIEIEQRDYDVSKQGYAQAAALGLTALKMINEGQFVRDTSSFEDQRLPFGRKKIKSKGKPKGARFKQKYREFRTTRFRHISSEPKVKTRSYSPTEHYTPRNVRSHFKERWVTLDYVEKHRVVNEDIIDIEDRTKSYKKAGEATKTWVKIKLWFEYEQDPDLEPTQEIERYRV